MRAARSLEGFCLITFSPLCSIATLNFTQPASGDAISFIFQTFTTYRFAERQLKPAQPAAKVCRMNGEVQMSIRFPLAVYVLRPSPVGLRVCVCVCVSLVGQQFLFNYISLRSCKLCILASRSQTPDNNSLRLKVECRT